MRNRAYFLAEGPSVTDWIQAVSGIVGALGTIAAFAALWLSIRQQQAARTEAKRLRLVPPPELQGLLLRLEERFGDIIASGGKPATWFMSPEQRRDQQLLSAHAGLIIDDELNGLVGAARAAYNDCFALIGDLDQADPSLVQQQVDAARQGRSSIVKAVDRSNALARAALPGNE